MLSYITDRYGDDPSEGLYKSTITEVAPVNLLYDEKIQEWIMKYMYCQRHNTQPFKADLGFEELPAIWIEFSNIMETELSKIRKSESAN